MVPPLSTGFQWAALWVQVTFVDYCPLENRIHGPLLIIYHNSGDLPIEIQLTDDAPSKAKGEGPLQLSIHDKPLESRLQMNVGHLDTISPTMKRCIVYFCLNSSHFPIMCVSLSIYQHMHLSHKSFSLPLFSCVSHHSVLKVKTALTLL